MTTVVKTLPKYNNNWAPFKLYLVYFDRLIFQCRRFWGVEFLRTLSSFKKRMENSSSYGYILQEMSH